MTSSILRFVWGFIFASSLATAGAYTWVLGVTGGVIPMVFVLGSAYFVAVCIVERMAKFPSVEVLVCILPAVGLIYLFATFVILYSQIYYSPKFMLIFFVTGATWICFSIQYLRSARKPTFAVIPQGRVENLSQLDTADWILLKNDSLGDQRVDGVVIDFGAELEDRWQRFTAWCASQRIAVYDADSIYEALTGRTPLRSISCATVLAIRQGTQFYPIFKRGLEMLLVILLAPFALILSLPLALAIKLDSTGPVLFKQPRIGLGGEPFEVLKFRTMTHDVDKGEGHPTKHITRVGRILRKWRLDEFPQLWHVMTGEMSLIGPRAEYAKYAAEFEQSLPFYSYRHMVRPGITGWAQVNQGHVTGTEATRIKLEYDFYYIKHLSFSLDLLIYFKTVRTVLTGFGAR